MNRALTLFTRDQCPLCDEAEQMLMALGLDYEKADISRNLQWLEDYRDRIPVVRRGTIELGWPFSVEQLSDLVGS